MRNAVGGIITSRKPAVVRAQLAHSNVNTGKPPHWHIRDQNQVKLAEQPWISPLANDGSFGVNPTTAGPTRQEAEALQAVNLELIAAKKAREQAEKEVCGAALLHYLLQS
eukprot:SAG31_NODE_27775_length_420_cov_0.947040_2_plen_109_part_01